MEIRNTTKFVLVHFTGDPSLSYSDIKKAHLDMGQSEIGFHFIIDSQGQILMLLLMLFYNYPIYLVVRRQYLS